MGVDTVIDYSGNIIGKIDSLSQAKQKIKKLSGKKHTIISSVAVYYNKRLIWANSERTVVKIRKLNTTEINKYLKKCGSTIFDSVGCYKIESVGPTIIEYIKGDFFNVMGFPLFSFLKFLKKIDLKKLNGK